MGELEQGETLLAGENQILKTWIWRGSARFSEPALLIVFVSQLTKYSASQEARIAVKRESAIGSVI